ncbi:MAG: phage major capsid protein [Sphingobium sp.]|nr:phage major capsid protein [Sphingobium sp.]
MKTSELIEQRAAIVARMNSAHGADDNDAFNTAEAELRALDGKLDRQRKIDAAERVEQGRPINGDVQLDGEIRSRFNLGRAIAGAAGIQGVDWGFEREVQPELIKRAALAPKGILIPTEIFETRVTTTSGASAIVATDHRPEQYISALVASSVVRSMGATVLSGLTGNVDIPRETGSPAIGWVAENSALSSGDATFDSVTLSPKHAGALSEWSRNMVMQSSPDVEALLRTMLARNLALAIDKAAILGGGSNEPTGILATSGIQTAAFTAPNLADLAADMIGKADIANVAARRGFLGTPGVKASVLKIKDTTGRAIPLSELFHGEPATFSNQVPTTLNPSGNKHGLIYADWTELLLGLWSEIDILVNPYESTAYSKGNISIRAMATVDCALRHKASFVSATGLTGNLA